jgi:hypothetical protein
VEPDHYADVPPGQARYVLCTHGAVLDVVDVRVGSPAYGRWDASAPTPAEAERRGLLPSYRACAALAGPPDG